MKISREMNPALSFLYPGLTVLRSPSAIFSVVLLALLLMMTARLAGRKVRMPKSAAKYRTNQVRLFQMPR